MHRFFIIYSIVVLACLFGGWGYAYLYLSEDTWEFLGREFGFLENATAIMFAVTAIGAGAIYFKIRDGIWLAFAFLMAAAGLREMDYHKAITTDSIFKTNFYEDPSIGLHEKAFGLAVIFALLYAVVKLARHLPQWITGLKEFHPHAVAVFLGIGALAGAKFLDGMKRYVPQLA